MPEKIMFRTRKSLLSPRKNSAPHAKVSSLPRKNSVPHAEVSSPLKNSVPRESLFSPRRNSVPHAKVSSLPRKNSVPHAKVPILAPFPPKMSCTRPNAKEKLGISSAFATFLFFFTYFVSIGSTHILWNIVPLPFSCFLLLTVCFVTSFDSFASQARGGETVRARTRG